MIQTEKYCLQQFRKQCEMSLLIYISELLTDLEKIYVKYLFKMDYVTTYRYIFPALAYSKSVTKSMIIETLFILKRWHEIKTCFYLDVNITRDCYIVAQFTNIPIHRKIICLLYMMTTKSEKQLFLNIIYAFLGQEHLRLRDDEEDNAILFFSYMDGLQLTRDVLLDIIRKIKNEELVKTVEILLAYNENAKE